MHAHSAVDEAGVPNELATIPNGGHGVYPDREKLRAQAEVFKFLEKLGVLEGAPMKTRSRGCQTGEKNQPAEFEQVASNPRKTHSS
jgi:hypothetical protein